jgi:hypothetical protein
MKPSIIFGAPFLGFRNVIAYSIKDLGIRCKKVLWFTVIFIRRVPSDHKSNKNLPHHLEQNGKQQNVSASRLTVVI